MVPFNLLLTLVSSIFLVSCSGLAERIDQVRDMVNPKSSRTADQNSKRNRTRAPEKSKESEINGGKWNDAASLDEKCEILLDWVGQVKREYPEEYKDITRKKPRYQQKTWSVSHYAKLLRDKYFVPIFGVTYQQMDASTRSSLYESVNRREEGRCAYKYSNEFQVYTGILNIVFAPDIRFSKEHFSISSFLKVMQAEEDRMLEGLAKIKNFSSTEESFNQLLAEVNRETNPEGESPILKGEIIHLWPSEINAFHEALKQKIQKVALVLFDEVLVQADNMPPSLTNMHLLKKELAPKTGTYLRVLENSGDAQSKQVAFNQKINSMLSELLDERIKQLTSIPSTWEGLEGSFQWESGFRKDFRDFSEYQEVKTTQAEFTKKREEIFQGARAEFETKLKALQPPTPDNMAKVNDFLQATFPLPGDRSLGSFGEFKSLVLTYQEDGLSSLVAPYLEQLQKIPISLTGALKLIDWRNSFQKEFSQFNNHPLVLQAKEEWVSTRRQILQTAKPDFQKEQQTFSSDQSGLREATLKLDSIFPTLNDQSLPIFKEYEQIVLLHPAAAKRNPISSSYDPPYQLQVSGLNDNIGPEIEKSFLAVFLGRFWVLRELHELSHYMPEARVKEFFYGFVAAYSEHCQRYLPADAKAYQHIRTEFMGTEDTGFREKTDYYKEFPDLLVTMRSQYYHLYSSFSDMARKMGTGRFNKSLRARIEKARQLIHQNGCEDQALRQFEDNLFLLASGKPSPIEAIGAFDENRAALPQMLAYADSLNIAHSDITQAMFRGDFNPNFSDLVRVYYNEMADEELRKLGGDQNKGNPWYNASIKWVNQFGGLTDEQLQSLDNPGRRESTTPWNYFRFSGIMKGYDSSNPRVEYEQLRRNFVSRLPDRYFKR